MQNVLSNIPIIAALAPISVLFLLLLIFKKIMPRIIDAKLQGNHIKTTSATIEPPSKVKAISPNIKLKKARLCIRSFFEWNSRSITTQIPQIIAIKENDGSIRKGAGIMNHSPMDIINKPNMKQTIFNKDSLLFLIIPSMFKMVNKTLCNTFLHRVY